MKAKVLLGDEPTESIQPNTIHRIGHVTDDLKAKNDMAIVSVDQYLDFACDHADQVDVFRRHIVALQGRETDLARETPRGASSV